MEQVIQLGLNFAVVVCGLKKIQNPTRRKVGYPVFQGNCGLDVIL